MGSVPSQYCNTRDFVLHEFQIAYVSYSSLKEDPEQSSLTSSQFLESKFMQKLLGDTMMCWENLNEITKHDLIWYWVQFSKGTVKEKIQYAGSMYSLTYGNTEIQDGYITKTDYLKLLDSANDHHHVQSLQLASTTTTAAYMTTTVFLQWLTQHPMEQELVISLLPPLQACLQAPSKAATSFVSIESTDEDSDEDSNEDSSEATTSSSSIDSILVANISTQEGVAQFPLVHSPPIVTQEYTFGYLHKKGDGKWSSGWHLRYFVLDKRASLLQYFKKVPTTWQEIIQGSGPKSPTAATRERVNTLTSSTLLRGSLDLKHKDASLLFERKGTRGSPSPHFFQVSTLVLGDEFQKKKTKKNVHFQLCAAHEENFMIWTTQIAECILSHKQEEDKTVIPLQQRRRQQALRETCHQTVHEHKKDGLPVDSTMSLPIHPTVLSTEWRFGGQISGRYLPIVLLVGSWLLGTIGLLSMQLTWQGFGVPTPASLLYTLFWTYLCLSFFTKAPATPLQLPLPPHDVPSPDAPLDNASTSPRYTLGASSTRANLGNKKECSNAWTTTDATSFLIRGRDYIRTKCKTASVEPLFTPLGMDIIQTDMKWSGVYTSLHLPSDHHLFIVNAQIPGYAPTNPIWGSTQQDGPGYSLILYFKIPLTAIRACSSETTPNDPSLRLLKKLLFPTSPAEAKEAEDRIKVIATVVPKEATTSASTALLMRYNGTPVLTRPQQTIFRSSNVTEVDVDLHSFCYCARKGMHTLMGKCKEMCIDVAIVLQGRSEEELPERVLGCLRLLRLDWDTAQTKSSILKTDRMRNS